MTPGSSIASLERGGAMQMSGTMYATVVKMIIMPSVNISSIRSVLKQARLNVIKKILDEPKLN